MAWWRQGQSEEQLEKELRFHLDEHVKELIARGRTPEQARREAKLALGGPEQVKEQCRDVRGMRWLEDLFQDTRYTLRTLRHQPGFAFITLCTLALGIGATTVMFTIVSGVLLKPLPYPQPGRLLRLQEKTEQRTRFGDLWAFAYPNFLDCQRESQTLTMAAWRFAGGTLSEPGEPEYVERPPDLVRTLFRCFGVPLITRTGLSCPKEDRPSGSCARCHHQPRFVRSAAFGSRARAAIGSHALSSTESATPLPASHPTASVCLVTKRTCSRRSGPGDPAPNHAKPQRASHPAAFRVAARLESDWPDRGRRQQLS